MPVIFDYKCTKCGETLHDHMLKDSSAPSPNCPICEEPMDKMFSGFQTKKGIRHHNKLPDNYQFSQGGANFGRLKDL